MITYKKVFKVCQGLVVAALVVSALSACVDDKGLAEDKDDYLRCIELLFSADAIETRTISGKSPFSDIEIEKLNKADLFFYTADATADASPVKVDRIETPLFERADDGQQKTHKISLSYEDIQRLFPAGKTTCKVYAVVNVSDADYTAAGVEKSAASINALKNMKANTKSFSSDFDGFVMFTDESATSVNTVTYNESERKATGTLKLKNLASKIELYVNFGDAVKGVNPSHPDGNEQNWQTWQPSKTTGADGKEKAGSVEVYIVNGTTQVPLKGWSAADFGANPSEITKELAADNYYDLRDNDGSHSRHLIDSSLEDKDKFPYVVELPFYSYPNEWTTDLLERHQTYLMMKVNWVPDNFDGDEPTNENLVESYYKIPINLNGGDSENKLLHNRYYRVKVNINTLGGINFGAPLELENVSCEVLPWGNAPLNTDIYEPRWLEITQEQKDPNNINPEIEYYQAVMNNTVMAYIPYNSSHRIVLADVKIQYYNFKPLDDSKIPQLVGILARRSENGTFIPNSGGIAPGAFILDQEKFDWFAKHEEEPNGVYIDEANSRIVFYKSVYTLAGYTQDSEEYNDIPKTGLYSKKGAKTYSPFFITLKFEHYDNPEFYKEIKIIQYPGVYVTFTENSGTVPGTTTPIGRRVASGSGTGTTGRYGVYINGGATNPFSGFNENDGSNSLQLGGIGGQSRTDNPNMYSIHVTQLSDDEIMSNVTFGHENPEQTRDVKFYIGDPRAKFVNNELGGVNDLTDAEQTQGWNKTNYSDNHSGFRKLPATINEGAQRLYEKDKSTLTYYYPTAEGQQDEQAFRISPVFRLASGNTDVYTGRNDADNLSRENARRRCAALQENGYPAGRWRLPTIGEMLFFRMLQKKQIIPEVFGKDGSEYRAHWTAQYLMKFDKNDSDVRMYLPNDGMSHKWVRCVYDDWYWVREDGSPDIIRGKNENNQPIQFLGWTANYDPNPTYPRTSPNYTTDGDWREMFVWGDKPKNNPQDQPQDQTSNP